MGGSAPENRGHAAGESTEPYVVILFSIHYVLKAEQLLKKKGVRHDVVPVPREISSDCGMAIIFAPENFTEVCGVLDTAQIAIARMFRKGNDGIYREINWKES